MVPFASFFSSRANCSKLDMLSSKSVMIISRSSTIFQCFFIWERSDRILSSFSLVEKIHLLQVESTVVQAWCVYSSPPWYSTIYHNRVFLYRILFAWKLVFLPLRLYIAQHLDPGCIFHKTPKGLSLLKLKSYLWSNFLFKWIRYVLDRLNGSFINNNSFLFFYILNKANQFIQITEWFQFNLKINFFFHNLSKKSRFS